MKRTYNLPEGTVAAVRELAEQYGVAPSQDAVIEMAVDELRRRVLEAHEAEVWATAAEDPAFRAEVAAFEACYGETDAESWPP